MLPWEHSQSAVIDQLDEPEMILITNQIPLDKLYDVFVALKECVCVCPGQPEAPPTCRHLSFSFSLPLSPSVVVPLRQQGVVGRELDSRWVCESAVAGGGVRSSAIS